MQGMTVLTEDRVFFAPKAFLISLLLLYLNLVAVILMLFNRPRAPLPRMPTNILALACYARHSHLLKDILDRKMSAEEAEKDSEERYGHGTFVGTDGRPHVGIERSALLLNQSRRHGLRARIWAWRPFRSVRG